MKKILQNGKIVGFSDFDPILAEGQTAQEAEAGEYEAWVEANQPKPIHYVTIEIPLQVLATNEELQKKLVFLRLVYSHMESITRQGITYLSHIDITDILDFLPKEEFVKFRDIGVKFPPEVEALYSEGETNEETTV
ncbi:MAG: hypothetical protein DLD55_02705 [candidate division SR1 bacterium]|nr:MAG: hypothetical protein DLD55_02705 [candidate division SR1 bacterium]